MLKGDLHEVNGCKIILPVDEINFGEKDIKDFCCENSQAVEAFVIGNPFYIDPDYQPIVNENGTPTKYETLLRAYIDLRSGESYEIPLKYFMPVISKNGAYKKCISRVIEKSIMFARQESTRVTLNFGKKEFQDPDDDYMYLLDSSCDQCCVKKSNVTIEILEEIPPYEIEKEVGITRLKEISTKGYELVIDDLAFKLIGEGDKTQNSYLDILNTNPEVLKHISSIKIDMNFVWEIFGYPNCEPGEEDYFEEERREQKTPEGQKEQENKRFFLLSLMSAPHFKGKSIILEGIRGDKILEAIDFIKSKCPESNVLIQCFDTGRPSKKSAKPVNFTSLEK